MSEASRRSGPIAWMARNRVAANLLMAFFIIGGLVFAQQVKQEVFPEVDLNLVTIQVPYPGATPVEVEQGIVLAVEEAVRGLDGVKEVRATATEGLAVVSAELFTFAQSNQVLNDIKSAVDRITSFPANAEEPVVKIATNRQEVISLILYGDLTLHQLKQLSEQARQDLQRLAGITLVQVDGIPPPEISIEVPQENLRRYRLTLPQLANIVAQSSVNISGGSIETKDQEILVRITEKRLTGQAFENVVVLSKPNGEQVRLKDIAQIHDGYADVERAAYFNDFPAVRVRVFRVGEQTPIGIAESVQAYQQRLAERLPENVQLALWNNSAEIYRDRIGLLIENGRLGALLVLVILGLFLQFKVAFWVTIGMPAAFLGAFLFMPVLGVSINMISLFAFLLVLGIVVDDAIVVGEASYNQMSQGKPPPRAAVDGAYEVLQPVSFAVLTTIIAFTPLLFVPGVSGEFFRNIPLIVIPILCLSLVESFFILPAHLGHSSPAKTKPSNGLLHRLNAGLEKVQKPVASTLERVRDRHYQGLLRQSLAWRYLTLAMAIAILLVIAALPMSGRLAFNFLPKLQGDIVSASIVLPVGSTREETRAVMQQVTDAAQQVIEQNSGSQVPLTEGIYASLGQLGAGGGDPGGSNITQAVPHQASIAVALSEADRRDISARAFTEQWREALGPLPGVDSVRFQYSIGPSAGAKIAIELAHDNREQLRQAARELAEQMRQYAGVEDIDDGYSSGKEELQLELKPVGRAMGLSETSLAQQIRGAFYGIEALRQQRGRDELKVFVRLPDAQVNNQEIVQRLIIQTPQGGELTLDQAAALSRGLSFTEINRENGRRVVEVTADVDPQVTTGGQVTQSLIDEVMPSLQKKYNGLSFELSGEQQEQQETLATLGLGMALALFVMFAVMAIAFKSYWQPIIVLSAVPFGIIGAVIGHLIMGYSLSLVSMLGMVALSGVVVNDALVLVAAINNGRQENKGETHAAVVKGALRRFRPVLLTSLTTFFGLAPMIFETSLQARFLIPMAISLGFGILFVTLVVLFIVPSLYCIVEDFGVGIRRLSRLAKHRGALT